MCRMQPPHLQLRSYLTASCNAGTIGSHTAKERHEMNWTAPIQTLHRRGTLLSIGIKRLGLEQYEYVKCVNCATEYPILERTNYNTCIADGALITTRAPSCNGHNIDQCPWCREDSEPWKNGRGI